MSIIIKESDYKKALKDSMFLNQKVPVFADYEKDYQTSFLRYLYYICIMDAKGDYPTEVSKEEIENTFANIKGKCKPKINKILIGEALPPNFGNYFYNTNIPWKNGMPDGSGRTWVREVKKALFHNVCFSTQTEFLTACAKNGFLLIDLFPYAISYSGKRKTKSYQLAAMSAMNQILIFLDSMNCCLHDEIAIAFGMKSFGDILLTDAPSVANISTWLLSKGKTLTPPILIDKPRVTFCYTNSSKFLRVCGVKGSYGPVSDLLKQSGII